MTRQSARRDPRRLIGPAIAVVAVLVFTFIAVLALTGRENVVRPEVGTLPVPEGAVVRHMEEHCPTAEPLPQPPPDDRTVCDTVLAVSPRAEIDLPGTTEDHLVAHFAELGWRGEAVPGAWLSAPESFMRVRIESFEQAAARDPDLADAIRGGLSARVSEEDIAVVTVLP